MASWVENACNWEWDHPERASLQACVAKATIAWDSEGDINVRGWSKRFYSYKYSGKQQEGPYTGGKSRGGPRRIMNAEWHRRQRGQEQTDRVESVHLEPE